MRPFYPGDRRLSMGTGERKGLARPERFELPTFGFVGRRSPARMRLMRHRKAPETPGKFL